MPRPDGASTRVFIALTFWIEPARFAKTLPLRFEANVGQADPRVRFLSRLDNYDLLLTFNEALIQLRAPNSPTPRDSKVKAHANSTLLRMRFAGSAGVHRVVGLDQLPAKSNYFIGNDKTKWRSNVPTYSRVMCQNIYRGVDLLFYGNSGELEYDLIVAPGADPAAIRISFDGARQIRLDDSGTLLIETPAGEIRQHKPVIYQERMAIETSSAAATFCGETTRLRSR